MCVYIYIYISDFEDTQRREAAPGSEVPTPDSDQENFLRDIFVPGLDGPGPFL